VRSETALLHDIITTQLQTGAAPTRLVIDTGGSSIYAGAELFARLRQFVTIAYLALSEAAHDQMLMDYLQYPRPLIWRSSRLLCCDSGLRCALPANSAVSSSGTDPKRPR